MNWKALLLIVLAFGGKCAGQLAIDADFYDGEEDYYTATTDDPPEEYQFNETDVQTYSFSNSTMVFTTANRPTTSIQFTTAAAILRQLSTNKAQTSSPTTQSIGKSSTVNRVLGGQCEYR